MQRPALRIARVWRAVLVAMLATVLTGIAVPDRADAEFIVGGRLEDPRGPLTELVITDTGAGGPLSAYDAPASFDPLEGYPTALPAGSVAHPVDWAGTILVTDPTSGTTTTTYCIDLNTDTEIGINYHIGDWDESNVPNLGYVGYILHNYYPTTDQPAGTAATKARVVQAAIWFFTDRVVLDPSNPDYAAVAAVVTDALTNGPSPEPEHPELTVTPETMRAPSTGDIVGPFHVSGNGSGTLSTTGVEVFTDPDGTNRLSDGDTVAAGTDLWVRSVSDTEPQGFPLERTAEILESTVYLYDGTNPGRDTAQKLVLAQATELTLLAGATITPYPAGNLAITKRISGSGAGFQGEITVRVTCTAPDDTVTEHEVTVAAGAGAGTIAGRSAGWTPEASVSSTNPRTAATPW